MGAEQGAVKGDLDGVADQANLDRLPAEAVADAIGRAGEADRTVRVDDAQDSCPLGGLSGTACVLRTAVHLVVIIDEMTPCMRRDHRAAVGDVQETVGRLDHDRFARQVTPDVIAVLEDADATGSIDSASDDFLDRRQFLFDLDVAV